MIRLDGCTFKDEIVMIRESLKLLLGIVKCLKLCIPSHSSNHR